jgi:hypothetical protein
VLVHVYSAIAGKPPAHQSAPGSSGYLWAATIGCRVPRKDCKGRVEAVFEHACNVALDSGGLVTVLAHHAGSVVHGIRLFRNQWFDHRLRPGVPVRLGADRVIFDNGAVTVMLSAAAGWTPGFGPGKCDWSAHSRGAALLAREMLCDHAERCSSDFLATVLRQEHRVTPLARRVSAIIPRLALAARTRDADGALHLLAQLVGAGPGLTPAGDDFIIGWLAGLALLAQSPAQFEFLHAMGDSIGSLKYATTSVSAQHLDDACAMMFSERLSDLCMAIAAGEPKGTLGLRLAAQLAVGSTSGADAAAGLMFALFDCGPAVR